MLTSVAFVICHRGKISYKIQFKNLCTIFMKKWKNYIVFMIKWDLFQEPKVDLNTPTSINIITISTK